MKYSFDISATASITGTHLYLLSREYIEQSCSNSAWHHPILEDKSLSEWKENPIGNICKSMTWIYILSCILKRSYHSLFIQVSIWQEWGGHNRQLVCICIHIYIYMIYYWLFTNSQHIRFIYFLVQVAYRTLILW